MLRKWNVFHFFLFYFHHWISPCEVKQPTLFCRIPSYLNLKQITRKTNLKISSFILCFSLLTQHTIALIKCSEASSSSDWREADWQKSFRATKLRQDKSCYGGAKTELVCPGRDASQQPASQPARGQAGTAVWSHMQRYRALSLFAVRTERARAEHLIL